jgi:hypothetical protein
MYNFFTCFQKEALKPFPFSQNDHLLLTQKAWQPQANMALKLFPKLRSHSKSFQKLKFYLFPKMALDSSPSLRMNIFG